MIECVSCKADLRFYALRREVLVDKSGEQKKEEKAAKLAKKKAAAAAAAAAKE